MSSPLGKDPKLVVEADPDGVRQGKSHGDSKTNTASVTTKQGKRVDKLLDDHQRYEFGGPFGVTLMMIGFPTLMYYLWICIWFYDGQLTYPSSLDDMKPFLLRMWAHIRDHANPDIYAWKIYSGAFFFQLFIAWILPGYQQEGLPVPSLGYKTLMYNCNGLYCLYVSMVTASILHYTSIFRLTEIIDNYGHLMSVAIIYSFVISFGVYWITVTMGQEIRMSGNFIYDVWMGACLNPRLGSIDLKMWAEVRIPWVFVFFFAVSGGCKQYEQYGYVTPNMAFMILATWLYVNACVKGEECIPQTWDMYYEKWGFMVIFWNFAGVPFTYVYSIVYMATHDPSVYRFPTPVYVAMFMTLLTAYYIFDTSMSQKSRFKMQGQGINTFRKTFPQLPWGTLNNPEYIQTAHGNRLLISGWWKYCRKPNYSADWTMAIMWGLVVGAASPIPYFYPLFFLAVLTHRCGRDFERCSVKYGKDWERYCEVVKYKFIPGIY